MVLALLLGGADNTYAIFNKVKTPDYYEANAREHFRHNRWSEGKKLLDEGWKDYGDLSVMNELMGKYYYHFKEYDKARFYLVKALRDDNTNTQARELLVNVEEETHNYSSAICYINELLERNPYSRGWWRRKINIYRKQGNREEANRLLERLQRIYPNDNVIKKDIAFLNEQNLIRQKRNGDLTGQLESLQNLVKTYPDNEEYYLALCNMLLQSGRVNEAAEVAGRGARITGSVALMKKRADILAEQGLYTEAINYLKECSKTTRSAVLTKEINEIEKSAAENAQLNDPYTSMARVYAKQHSAEALNYLLNTAISRGYYDDALMYIKDAKGSGKGTPELLYKEFIVNRRLGNKNAARGILEQLYTMNPRNEEVREYLSEMRYEAAAEQMNTGQYAEAIPDLTFVEENAVDEEMRRGAMARLYNCYFETKQYEPAQKQLDKLRDKYNYSSYILQSAALLKAQGNTEAALNLLAEAYAKADDDPQKAQLIAYQYEEYALPYIKGLIERGMIRNAYKAVKSALLVCPTSNELLHQAITTSDILGYKDDYEDMIHAGRTQYPGDPFFIVKEAGLLAAKGDHAEAVQMLRPELDTYIGDSALVRAFAEYSQQLAMDQAKAKAYNSAIATLDTALLFHHDNRELLYTKGLVYEAMHNYDSAYVYQKYYKPTLMDFREHSRHLEELQGLSFDNEITVTYQQARPGSEDVISANAYAQYLLKKDNNSYTFSLAYAGRDGAASENLTKEDMESGGTGVMLGLEWRHSFKDSPWAFSVGGAWASKYFPEITLKAALEREMWDTWLFNVHASYRRISTYTRKRAWVVNEEKYQPTDPDYVYVSTGWQAKYDALIQVGLTAQRTINKFLVQGSVDAFALKSKIYFNSQLKGQFFPFEGTRTHVFAMGGVGNAPQTELLDNSMPAGFSKLNTFVGGGFMWFLNRHIAASLAGTWYTMYRSQEVQTGVTGTDYSTSASSSSTDYKNMFYIQGQLVVTF